MDHEDIILNIIKNGETGLTKFLKWDASNKFGFYYVIEAKSL